jgi:hypothetical protein
VLHWSRLNFSQPIKKYVIAMQIFIKTKIKTQVLTRMSLIISDNLITLTKKNTMTVNKMKEKLTMKRKIKKTRLEHIEVGTPNI